MLKDLAERDLTALDPLAVWIDGLQLGSYHVICAVVGDAKGQKHVLGLREGATENAEVAEALLEDLVARGLEPKRRRLFVIDGSKALEMGLMSCSRSIALVCRVGCVAAWGRRTSSTTVIRRPVGGCTG